MTDVAAALDFRPRRAKARLRADISAALVTLEGRQPVSLLDLSETGARLEVRDPEAISGGILKWLDFEAFGSVVWRTGQTVGLEFEQPIAPGWVLDTKDWLPALPRGRDELRGFARDWVRGHAAREQRTRASVARGESGPKRSAAAGWLLAARPFILGGVLLGAVAGYCSTYL